MARKAYTEPRLTPFYDGPSIGRQEHELVSERRNRRGDVRLRDACLGLFARTANLRGLTMDEAMTLLLGQAPAKPSPGTERVYKTSSAGRLG